MKKVERKEGRSVIFEYDNVEFMFIIIGDYCECYANSYLQFGFVLGQKTKWNPEGKRETDDEIIEMLINNYEVGNLFFEYERVR